MKKIILLVLSLMLVCLTVCSCGSSDDGGSSNFEVGETAEIDDISITMISFTESSGTQFITPDEGKVFVLCEFNIENNSDEEISVSSLLSFEAYFDDYETDVNVSAMASSDKNQLDGSVAAGKKMAGVIGFEVPEDWSNLEISYKPNVFMDKKVTFVAEK